MTGTPAVNDLFDDFDDEHLSPLDTDFEIAVGHVRRYSEKLDQSALLYLYGRYKIATEGECKLPKPGFFDFRNRQKWEVWKSLGNLNRDTAKSEYISYVYEKLAQYLEKTSSSDEKLSSNNDVLGSKYSKFVIEDHDFDNSHSDSDSLDERWLNAVKNDDAELCKLILAEEPVVIFLVDSENMNVFHWAADRCSLNVLKWLFGEVPKSDLSKLLNAQDADGQTALHYAASCDHLDVVKLLLQYGANRGLCDNDGNKPIDIAASDEMKSVLISSL